MRQKLIATIIALVFLGLLAHRVWRSAQLDPAATNYIGPMDLKDPSDL